MQKVERKKTRKGFRAWWLLPAAVLLVGSLFLVFSLKKPDETDPPAPPAPSESPETPGGIIISRELSTLLSVTVTQRGETPWTLTWDESGAHLNGAEWIADERLADRIRNDMTSIAYADILIEGGSDLFDPEEFGLADPLLIAEASFTDGQTAVVRLGDPMPGDEGWYYMTMDGDPRLYAVSASVPENLDIDPQMLYPVPQPEIYKALVDRITVYGSSGEKLVEWRLRGSVTDQDAKVNWEISAPFTYPADWERIQKLKTTAENLRMGIFLEDATPEALAARGLAQPDYTLEIHMAAGRTGTVDTAGSYARDPVDREERTETFLISRSENEMIDYVLYDGAICSVSHDISLSAFLDTPPMDTAARYLAAVPLNSLESLTIEDPTEKRAYTLDRTGDTPVCRLNGEDYPYEAFEASYERLLTVTVSGILPADAVWQEPHTVYTFTAVSGNVYTAAVSAWDGTQYAVTLDGSTLFYLFRLPDF